MSDRPSGSETADDGASSTSAGESVGRRGVVGVVLGAAAAGAVAGIGGSRLFDSGGDASPAALEDTPNTPVADPPPAAPDKPPIELTSATPSRVDERGPRDQPAFDPNSPLNRMHDLRVAHQVIDDFPDAAAAGIGDRVGSAGWVQTAGGQSAGSTVPASMDGGVVRLTTGPAPTGRVGLHLGLDRMTGLPVFTMEWRLAWNPVGDKLHESGVVFGCLDTVSQGGTAPSTGVYFMHRPDLASSWLCVCAGTESRVVVDTAVEVGTGFHRYRITADGDGLCRFYIDDERVGSITSTAPSANDRYGVGIEVFKSAGTQAQSVDLDWFFLRRELVR